MLKTIFVVDDSAMSLSSVRHALKDRYQVITFISAAKMFEAIGNITPDLILLDIEMPEMDGFESLAILKANKATAKIPVIFLTSSTDADEEVRGFQMGVIDFISKPFSVPVLQNRIKTHLGIDLIIQERTRELQNLKSALVFTLADMVENRDRGTGGHIERTTTYAKILIEAMIARGVYSDVLSKMNLDLVISSARLHDIGKVSIPDSILNKPGKLTYDEFEAMKDHCREGERIIDNIMKRADNSEFLANARLIVNSHHEWWDGTGYPLGLSGTDIPLLGRITAIVDVYDALVSERSYKKAFTHDESVKIIMDGAGSQFDPRITEVFFDVKEQFEMVTTESVQAYLRSI